jgi:nucleoside-diphosphate-sugar epimerase
MNSSEELVLVTGSSGYIGSAAVKRLSQRYRVVGLDREGLPPPEGAAEAVEVDLGSDKSVECALRHVQEKHGDRLASIVHLAAYYSFSGEPSPLYEEITVRGTERLLKRAKQLFALEQFIFSSTMLVHAPCESGERITEDSPLAPKWDYPQSKVETEKLIRSLHGVTPYVLLRIAGVYDDTGHSIPLANQMQRIYERWLTSHVYPGDTSRGQAFLHRDDLVDALERLVERRLQLPSELTLLLGESEPLSYDELQREFGRLIHGEEWETRRIPKAAAKAGAWLQDQAPLVEDPFIKPWMIDLADDHYALDITRARTVLGWAPKHALRESLPNMVAALKADPARWYQENKLTPPSEVKEQAAENG